MEPKIGQKQRNLLLEELENNVERGIFFLFRWYNHLRPKINK